MVTLKDLRIKIFADGADATEMRQIYRQGIVKGFTTNPSLMRKASVRDYESFAQAVLKDIQDLPISFEVFSDDFASMEREAKKIASWGKNVYVKIPITNTEGKKSLALIQKLSSEGLCLNITAVLMVEQVREVVKVLHSQPKAIVSVFAGRIADTGRDPMLYMREAADALKSKPNAELLWASSRELLNIFQAQACGCHIITVTNDILKKISMVGKDLQALSLDTVKQFYQDARDSGYKL
jgi:transaldolase